MRRILLILLIITTVVSSSDARRRRRNPRPPISPKNILFIGFQSQKENHTEKIRKINKLFIEEVQKIMGKEVNIHDLSVPYLFSKEQDLMNLAKSHSSRWILSGKVSFYRRGDFRISVVLNDAARRSERKTLRISGTFSTLRKEVKRTGPMLDIIADANGYFFKKKNKLPSPKNSYRTLALLGFDRLRDVPASMDRITGELTKTALGQNRIKIIPGAALRPCRFPGVSLRDRKRLRRISSLSGARWILSGLISRSETGRSFNASLMLFDGRKGRHVQYLKVTGRNKREMLLQVRRALPSIYITISASKNFFLHNKSDFLYAADFSYFGHSAMSSQYNVPYAVHYNGKKLFVSCFDRITIMSPAGKPLKIIGSRGAGEGQYQYPAGIDTDNKGNLYILDSLGKKIITFSPEGKFIREFFFNARAVRDFTVTDSGNVLIPDYSDSRLLVFDSKGSSLPDQTWAAGSIQGMVRIPGAGGLLVARDGLYYIIILDSRGGKRKTKPLAISQSQLILNSGVMDAQGRFYSRDISKSLIIGTDKKGNLAWVKKEIRGVKRKFFNMPYDMSIDRAGNRLFLVDMQNKRVISFLRHRLPGAKKNARGYFNRSRQLREPLKQVYLNMALHTDSGFIPARMARARYYAKSGHHDRAIYEYRKALTFKPRSKRAKKGIHESQYARKISEARYFTTLFNRAIKTGPESARPYYAMAVKAFETALVLRKKDEGIKKEFAALKKSFAGSDTTSTGRPAVVNTIVLNDVFSALYKYYAENSIGTVSVKNTTGSVIERIHASVQIRGYMDYPTETRHRRNIAPGDSVSLKVFAVFNNNILSISEDTPISVRIVVHYTVGGVKKTLTNSKSLTIFNRNAMTWDRTEKLAAFITPRASAVKVTARSIAQKFRNSRLTFINQQLQTAMQLFAALGTYGMTYVQDPKTPFKTYSSVKNKIDFIQYPGETLRYRTGDCDDLTVLMAALLENLGIDTALVTVPGHIFLIFNTGVAASDSASVSLKKERLVIRGGTIWIPIETTLLGSSFIKAWAKGADEYRRFSATGELKVHETLRAWKTFSPATLHDTAWEPRLPGLDMINRIYNRDINTLIETELKARLTHLRREHKNDPSNPKILNSIGVTLARFEKYERAHIYFKKALVLHPGYVAAHNNSGNIYLLQGNKKAALKAFRKAKKINPRNARIHMNIALIFMHLNKPEKVLPAYNEAVRLDASLKTKYSWLIKSNDTGGIRSDKSGRRSNPLWIGEEVKD